MHLKVGIDECGRGSWAGDAYVAAFCASVDWTWEGLRDSKKLPKPKVYSIAKELVSFDYKLEIIPVKDIDDFGIHACILRAFKQLVRHYQDKFPGIIVEIDGSIVPAGVKNCVAIKDGDDSVPHIMAAAVIAKYSRDKYMTEQAKKFPGYGWTRNAGYGTQEHMEALNRLGLSPIHRVSFKPVRKFLHEERNPIGVHSVSIDLYKAWREAKNGSSSKDKT